VLTPFKLGEEDDQRRVSKEKIRREIKLLVLEM